MWEHLRIRRELNDAIGALLTLDELTDLEALFYTGRGSEHGEDYELALQHVKNNQRRSAPGAAVEHILSKTSLLENMILGGRLVGRPSLSTKLRAIRPIVDDAATLSLNQGTGPAD
jgi:hypothetical protein